MIVCLCAAVKTSDVLNANTDSLRQFKKDTGACRQCCKCHDHLAELWQQREQNACPPT
jgi:bacterioferritin-associated ferredoxin